MADKLKTAKEQIDAEVGQQRRQRELDRKNGADQLSAQQRYANMQLARAGMPPAEKNDTDAGEGARRKLPVRYD